MPASKSVRTRTLLPMIQQRYRYPSRSFVRCPLSPKAILSTCSRRWSPRRRQILRATIRSRQLPPRGQPLGDGRGLLRIGTGVLRRVSRKRTAAVADAGVLHLQLAIRFESVQLHDERCHRPSRWDYTVSEKFLCTIWPPVAQRLTTDSIEAPECSANPDDVSTRAK